MLSPAEIRRSFLATWLFFRGQPDALQLLDRSLAGFWRSFAVIILVLPINAVTMLAVSRTDQSDTPAGTLILEGLPLMLADWVAFPILLALAAPFLNVSSTYVNYVVARNWAAPLASAVMTVPIVLQGAGWTDVGFTTFLTLIALCLVLRLHYMILRIALGAQVAIALGLVVFDIVLTLFLVRLFA